MNKERSKESIERAAVKALIAAAPHYHAWSAEQQERFRATMGEPAEARVDAVLLQEVAGVDCAPAEARKRWEQLPLATRNALNWAKLLTTGIGEDMLFLNELLPAGCSLLDFDTLYDYDHHDHLFQEQANREQDPGYPGREYRALRFSHWVRLLRDGQFHYATLFSLADYLGHRVDEAAHDYIQALIPHRHVRGKDHGKAEKGGTRWDLRIEADGLERQLEELQYRWAQRHYREYLEALHREFAGEAPAVYWREHTQEGEAHLDVVFNNGTALKLVHWKRFLRDCAALHAEWERVDARVEQELKRARAWLEECCEDILQNFDPSVVRLRRRRKIVIAPGALDGLLDDGGGEDDAS